MIFGLNHTPPHETPEQWAQILKEEGYRAAAFPVNCRAPLSSIDAYAKAAADYGIRIAEVGVWTSPFFADPVKRAEARDYCTEQLRLADYLKADCCVNVTGSTGDIWYGCYADNFSERMYADNVEFIQGMIDKAKPQYTSFALEPMQWMIPSSPEEYLQFLKDVNREHFGVHMDLVNFIKDPYTYTHQRPLIDKTFALLAPYIKSIHLKDCQMEDCNTVVIREVLAGTGSFDIPYYLETINKMDREVPVLLEHLDTMEQYAKALKYAKSVYSSISK